MKSEIEYSEGQSCSKEDFLSLRRRRLTHIYPGFIRDISSEFKGLVPLAIYIMLYDLAQVKDARSYVIYYSYSELALYFHVSTRNLIRNLKTLDNKGFIKIVRRKKEGKKSYESNEIRIRLPTRVANRLLKMNGDDNNTITFGHFSHK